MRHVVSEIAAVVADVGVVDRDRALAGEQHTGRSKRGHGEGCIVQAALGALRRLAHAREDDHGRNQDERNHARPYDDELDRVYHCFVQMRLLPLTDGTNFTPFT